MLHSIWSYAGSLKGYGSINPDMNVTRSFEAFQVNPNFSYYILVLTHIPTHWLGSVKSISWSRIFGKNGNQPKDFKDKIHEMQTQALILRQSQHGFAILDDRGRQIGVWYSIPGATTQVKMQDDKTVLIYTPPLDTYGILR